MKKQPTYGSAYVSRHVKEAAENLQQAILNARRARRANNLKEARDHLRPQPDDDGVKENIGDNNQQDTSKTTEKSEWIPVKQSINDFPELLSSDESEMDQDTSSSDARSSITEPIQDDMASESSDHSAGVTQLDPMQLRFHRETMDHIQKQQQVENDAKDMIHTFMTHICGLGLLDEDDQLQIDRIYHSSSFSLSRSISLWNELLTDAQMEMNNRLKRVQAQSGHVSNLIIARNVA